MEDSNSISKKMDKMLADVREAGRLTGLHEDIIAADILEKYSGQYLEKVRSESNETASEIKSNN